MRIVIINDSTRMLRRWEQTLHPTVVKTYSHPNYLLSDLLTKASDFSNVEVYLFDRVFYGKDLIHDPMIKKIKEVCPNKKAFFVMTSAHHCLGDALDGFDLVLSSEAISLVDLLGYLNKE